MRLDGCEPSDWWGRLLLNRLSGWDAMLMYSETPNVHNHTLKVVVVNTADATYVERAKD